MILKGDYHSMFNDKEEHLAIYEDRYELYQESKRTVYYQGMQNQEARDRYAKINETLESGFLDRKINSLQSVDFSRLSESNRELLTNIVDGITSEAGRALVGLAFLQLTIKSIAPEQSIRLHKGAVRRGSFSWADGISMRTIDSRYNTPFLRQHGLLSVNKYGVFMTRSLAENYPYSNLYKAEMRGPFHFWIEIVDAIEGGTLPPNLGLSYMMALLKNRSENFHASGEKACNLAMGKSELGFNEIRDLIEGFFNTTNYSARAFEVAMHGLYQAMGESELLGDLDLVPMSQMRSANKKHGNIGDVELEDKNIIIESWDAKYGKPYLRDELEELRDKLLYQPNVEIAGFVVNSPVDMREDIRERVKEISMETGTDIYLFSFSEWLAFVLRDLSVVEKDKLAHIWLMAVVESFAQKRQKIAPIDEPCDLWIQDLINILE